LGDKQGDFSLVMSKLPNHPKGHEWCVVRPKKMEGAQLKMIQTKYQEFELPD